MRPISHMGWVGRRLVLSLALFSLAVDAGAATLFPQPVHLTRRIEDPLTEQTTVVDEYYVGNRVITVTGDRVSIADHETQQLTEINRRDALYSVTPFSEIARARTSATPRRPAARTQATNRSNMKSLGMRRSATGRSVDSYEIDLEGDDDRVIVGVDRTITFSREALEIISGAAYPSSPATHHDAVMRAAAAGADFALPIEQTFTIRSTGRALTITNSVIRVGNELPPLDLTTIPRGARRVESSLITVPRLLEQLENPPESRQR